MAKGSRQGNPIKEARIKVNSGKRFHKQPSGSGEEEHAPLHIMAAVATASCVRGSEVQKHPRTTWYCCSTSTSSYFRRRPVSLYLLYTLHTHYLHNPATITAECQQANQREKVTKFLCVYFDHVGTWTSYTDDKRSSTSFNSSPHRITRVF